MAAGGSGRGGVPALKARRLRAREPVHSGRDNECRKQGELNDLSSQIHRCFIVPPIACTAIGTRDCRRRSRT
jgi:hypothetical protein